MSMQYCEHHDKFIDTDWDCEHFTEDGHCVEFIGYQLTNEEQCQS